MKVLSEIPNSINQEVIPAVYETVLYPISDKVLDYVSFLIDNKSTVILLSGADRLDFDATYIEASMFASAVKRPNTLFVDHNNKQLVNYVIKKIGAKNLLILNATMFIKYRPWRDILSDIQEYKKIADNVIVTLPINRFDFNRLKYSAEDIAKMLNGVILDDTVICQ